jgi:hypothetical protein
MKSSLLFFMLVLSSISSFSLSASTSNLSRFCFNRGDIDEEVCSVPLAVLIARGEEFNGKLVLLHGYFANGPVPILFANREDFLTSNIESGIVVRVHRDTPLASRLFDLNHHDITILGRYSDQPVDLFNYSASRATGSISEIRSVGDATMPWGYHEDAPLLISPKPQP